MDDIGNIVREVFCHIEKEEDVFLREKLLLLWNSLLTNQERRHTRLYEIREDNLIMEAR